MKQEEATQEGRRTNRRLFFSLDLLVKAGRISYTRAQSLRNMIRGDDHENYLLGLTLIYALWKEAKEEGGMDYAGPTKHYLRELGIIRENEEI